MTLLELMIVMAIVGVLAALAIPAYQDYVVRAQISEAIVFATKLKVDATEYYANHNAWPSTTQRVAFEGTFVENTTLAPAIATDGTVTVLFGSQAASVLANQGIQLHPDVDPVSGAITWKCGGVAYMSGGNGALDYRIGRYLPTTCREVF